MEQKALPLLEPNNIAAESAESGTPHHPGVPERLGFSIKRRTRSWLEPGMSQGRETVQGLPVRSAHKKRDGGGSGGAEEAPFVFS